MTRSLGSFTSCVGGFTMATGGVFTLDATTQHRFLQIYSNQPSTASFIEPTMNVTLVTLLATMNRPNM